MKQQVLNAMRAAGKPVSAGEVAKSLNADRKEVDKAFADLKKEGAIVSPVRCKWTVAWRCSGESDKDDWLMTYDEYIAQQQQAIDEEQQEDSCFLEYQPEGQFVRGH